MRKVFLCCFLFLAFSAAEAKKSAKQALAAAIQVAQSEEILCSATVGFHAVNLTQGKVIGGLNESRSMIPASTLKLLTTAAALEILGKDFRFETIIQYDGEVDEQGTLHGNIYIKGGGDPALGSCNFQDHYHQPHFVATWVQAIRAMGIKEVDGAVIGDDRIYTDLMIPDTWVIGDLGEYYGAGVSGLSIFDNVYRVTLQATREGETASLITTVPPMPEEVQTISRVKGAAIDRDLISISGLPYHPVRIIQGEMPYSDLGITLESTSPDPTYWAAYTLHQALQIQNIKVAQLPTTARRGPISSAARKVLYTTFSPPLSEIITAINHLSMNSYAEHLLKHLSLTAAGSGNTSSGIKALKQFWLEQGIDVTGMLLCDGSGLSRYNAITPKQIVEVLRYMQTSDNAEPFHESLPIVGETGNLANIFQETCLKGNLRAKSGSLSNVRGFAGYCTNKGGDDIAFAILVNHYDGPRSSVESIMGKVLEVLVQQK